MKDDKNAELVESGQVGQEFVTKRARRSNLRSAGHLGGRRQSVAPGSDLV